jgi:ABC-type antimicrobial peptide transport system permease subunit
MDPAIFKQGRQFLLHPEMLNRNYNIGSLVPVLKLVIAAAAGVLLIACTNLALLMIVRGARRRAEMVVRASLGVSRWQLIRQQTVESVILAVTAGAIGTVLSIWGTTLVVNLRMSPAAQSRLPGWLELGVDWRVAAFAFGVSLLTVAIVGIWPATCGDRCHRHRAVLGSRAGSVIPSSSTGGPSGSCGRPAAMRARALIGRITPAP